VARGREYSAPGCSYAASALLVPRRRQENGTPRSSAAYLLAGEDNADAMEHPHVDAERMIVPRKGTASPGSLAAAPAPSEDALLVRQMRRGDTDAGRRFVHDYYAGIYRYLLYLTGCPHAAEDLTQETFLRDDGGISQRGPENDSPNSLPLTAFPEVHPLVQVEMPEQELGQYALAGSPGFFAPGTRTEGYPGPWAVGRSPSFLEPNNAVVNARLARDPALQPRVSVQLVDHHSDLSVGDDTASTHFVGSRPGAATGKKITSADVLEVLHRASGVPIVADYYTRLYDPKAVSLHNQPLFEVLNQLADRLRLRWNREASTRGAGVWLQFRSISFYYARLKEVPNRQLTRWDVPARAWLPKRGTIAHSGRWRALPSHSPSRLHSATMINSSIVWASGVDWLTTKTPGMGRS
jgi:hypothetical protein